MRPQSHEPHQRQAIVDQERGALVRKIGGRLDDQGLERHRRVEGRTAASESTAPRKAFRRSRRIAHPIQSVIAIEKFGLAAHRIIAKPTKTTESKIAEIGEVFRSVQLHGA
ncbi:MAG: hypothetical protein ABSA66_19360 [Roseiarcus sp.]